ncbi:MAG: metallophosphoesterase family protein [Cyanobacteria bacterium J06638_28]
MSRREDLTIAISGTLLVLATLLVVILEPRLARERQSAEDAMVPGFLTDPFLQYPTSDSVRVVWFTEFEGRAHTVVYGTEPGQALEPGNTRQVFATTRRLSRVKEDEKSQLSEEQTVEELTPRAVWRHEAEVTGLTPGERVFYQVISEQEDRTILTSDTFSLAAAPPAGQPLKILLTSDHQQMPMTATNLQKVEETIGQVDAVFVAGDLVNIPDRASEWFDRANGSAFFPLLQGRGNYALEAGNRTITYRGGQIIQEAPLFPAIGNHEVMGRASQATPLNEQFNDPVPRSAAIAHYDTNPELFNPSGDPEKRRQWIIDHSYNTDTYEEIFSLPKSAVPNPERAESTSRYYAVTFGDVRLIALFVTNIWRTPGLGANVRGRFRESQADLTNPIAWGHGQHIFEPIQAGSLQYQWLQQELNSEAFQQAKYTVVMMHHPIHSLGDNVVPAFTDPVPIFDRNEDGSLRAVRYEYPLRDDYLMRDLVPLLETAGVDLVLYGHSHLWNRFESDAGMHFLETSNVGNTYHAYWQEKSRPMPPAEPTKELDKYQQAYYTPQGDPNGLEPIVPTLAPLEDEQGNPLPFIASNEITAFSIFDTGTGAISSYYFDTREPNSDVVKFDEFTLGE